MENATEAEDELEEKDTCPIGTTVPLCLISCAV